MSDPKGSDSSDANNSDGKSKDLKLSDAEANDPIQRPAQNPEVSQSNSHDKADERVNSDPSLSSDETVIIEMQELSSDESAQRRISNVVKDVKISYELPDDMERNERNQSINKIQKRRNDGKNVQLAKKLKNDRPYNKDSKNKNKGKEKSKTNRQPSTYEPSPNGSSNEDGKNGEYNCNNMETDGSRGHRPIAIPIRRLVKGKNNKTPTHTQTNGKTIAFKRLAIPPSLSSGSLADVEDNADSQSNDDIGDENSQESTSMNRPSLDPDDESSSNVDIDKKSYLLDQTKSDNGASRVDSEPSTSQPVGDKGGKSSSTNQLKLEAERRRKRRCFVCNKKLGLTAFNCRCGGLYCTLHRYDREHDCKFDYKSMGAEEIRKNNPQIVAEKISKL